MAAAVTVMIMAATSSKNVSDTYPLTEGQKEFLLILCGVLILFIIGLYTWDYLRK